MSNIFAPDYIFEFKNPMIFTEPGQHCNKMANSTWKLPQIFFSLTQKRLFNYISIVSYLRQDPALKPSHIEQQVRIILGVSWDETVLPLDGGHGARQSVLYVPEYCATTGEENSLHYLGWNDDTLVLIMLAKSKQLAWKLCLSFFRQHYLHTPRVPQEDLKTSIFLKLYSHWLPYKRWSCRQNRLRLCDWVTEKAINSDYGTLLSGFMWFSSFLNGLHTFCVCKPFKNALLFGAKTSIKG